MLQLKHIFKQYNQQNVLCNLSLTAASGEIIGLSGESGSGKTTLMRIIAGLEQIEQGEVWIDQKLMTGNRTFVSPNLRSVGMVFQVSALWSHMTAERNILYARKKEIDYLELCRRLKIDTLLNRKPNQLSGGQQRRVSFVRALASNPRILLLDEATTNINKELKRAMLELLKEFVCMQHTTVIYATHHEEELEGLTAKRIMLKTLWKQEKGEANA